MKSRLFLGLILGATCVVPNAFARGGGHGGGGHGAGGHGHGGGGPPSLGIYLKHPPQPARQSPARRWRFGGFAH